MVSSMHASNMPSSEPTNALLSNTTTLSPKNNSFETFNYEALIQNLGVGIIKHDIMGRIVVANGAALSMLGLTKDELNGKTSVDPTWNVIHEDGSNFPGHMHPVHITLTTQQPVHNTIMGVYRPATNDRIWLLVNADPQFDNYGTFSNVLVTFTDITAYKKIQNELYKKNKVLESISNNSLDVIGIMDVTGQYHYVSKAATIISGYSEEELLHVNALDLAPKKTKAYIKKLLQSLPQVGKVENMLGKIICKDDSIKYISWSFQWDANAQLIYVNGRDKTKEVLKAREAEAKRVAEELEKRHLIFQAEEQKLNDISYELHENVGQIIATIKMYLDSYEKTGHKAMLEESRKLLALCIDELRTITYVNSMPKFEEVGFANAIEILIQLQFKKQNVVHALHFDVAESAISDVNKINIFRLTQLWLSHLTSREGLLSVIINISNNENILFLSIADEVAIPINHVDYLSPDLMPIKERLNIIGGNMYLEPSVDNKCFTITFELKKQTD